MALAAVTVPDDTWDAFCAHSPGAWFWHTTAWRAYNLAYRPDLESRPFDFGVVDDGDLIGIVPLTLEQHRDGDRSERAFTFGGGPCWAPAVAGGSSSMRASAMLRFALEHIDALAEEHDVDRATLAVSPLVPEPAAAAVTWVPAALRGGYLDASRASQVVDLGADPDALLKSMSKGHRAAVGRARKTLTVDTVAGKDDDDVFSAYQRMHQLAAGRVTRPQRTFDLMREWVLGDNAVLFGARRDSTYLGFAYVLRFGSGAYYASAANDPTEAGQPVGHALQWQAMTWLRENGIRTYELGAQPFATTPHDPASEKELNIARFKRGFGGEPMPFYIGEKYWTANAFGAVRARLDAFAARLRSR